MMIQSFMCKSTLKKKKKNTTALDLFLFDNNQLSANNSCAKSENYCDVFPLCRSDLPSKWAHCSGQSLEALVAEVPANRLQPMLQIWQWERAEGHDHQMQQRRGKPHHNSDLLKDIWNNAPLRMSAPCESTAVCKATNSYQIHLLTLDT